MENYEVKYSTQAINDLKGIHAYIKYNLASSINAQKQTKRIRDAIRELDSFPNRYPLVEFESWAEIGMHKLIVDNYVVLYFVNDETHIVDISRIFYSGRNIEVLAK